MSEVVIRATDLRKVYRLYSRPHYRFLDMFGLLRRHDGAYTEHSAVSGIDLEIRRGEKVAIIGRNGAGKSTLLKLITNVIEPTSGKMETFGDVHALLQIGTGFHPDFTGRENVYSYFANLGVTGAEADRRFAEVVEFAELEEYINQPVKTYSTGMGARLAFATSTAISPDILVLDEVLGVGDAYFSQKSHERIRALCDAELTTLLLVTHDLYSAMKICERFIWIDQGKVLLDDDAATVANRYEASIRDQQERRLRQARLKSIESNRAPAARGGVVYGQIRCRGTTPIDTAMPVHLVRFRKGGQTYSVSLEVASDGRNGGVVIDAGEGNWGDLVEFDGRKSRAFTPAGSIYHRAPFLLSGPDLIAAMDSGGLEAEVEFKDTSSQPCIVEIFFPDGITRLSGEVQNRGTGEWASRRITLAKTTNVDTTAGGRSRFGTQHFSIIDVKFLDGVGQERHIFNVGGSLRIKMKYLIRTPDFDEQPVIQVNFVRAGVRTHRFVLENARFNFRDGPEGEVEIVVDRIAFGPGEYYVNVVAMRAGAYLPDAKQTFYTANEAILDHHSRAYEISIEPTGNRLVDTCVFLHDAVWYKDGNRMSEGRYWLDDTTRRRAGR